MARKKYKLTGFARFFIVMLFLAPVAYLAANFINGEDGVEKVKQLFNIEQTDSETTTIERTKTEAKSTKTMSLQEEVNMLKDSLRSKEFQIQELKRQIRLLEGSSE